MTLTGTSVEKLEGLYQSGYSGYVRVAEAITGNVESARDAVQEGFASALRHKDSYRGSGSVEGWVWRCVVNAARMARRTARQSRLDDAAISHESTAPATLDGDLRPFIAQLPERQRLVLFLRYYADLDYNAIGGILAISSGTVGATLSAAHRALAARLQEGVDS